MNARSAATRAFWILLCGALPLLALYFAIAPNVLGDSQAADFHFNYYYAAEAIRAGENFYPPPDFVVRGPGELIIDYVYPPLVALLTVPWTLLPVGLAEVLFQFLLVAVFVATLVLLGVRDWRCYGLAFLWPPVLSAIQTGNVTLWLGLAAALAWRYRERLVPPAAGIGITLAGKFFLWPLVVWQAATRRYASAALSCVIGASLLLVSWAVIGFAGMTDYPDLVRTLEDTVGEDSYTAYIVGLDLGLPSPVARGLWLTLGLALVAAVIVLGRRGAERSAFVLAIAASLALTPIVWLHYFALLLVVVAVARASLGVIWFVPLALVVTPGSGHPSPFETSATLAIAALTFALAVRESQRGR